MIGLYKTVQKYEALATNVTEKIIDIKQKDSTEVKSKKLTEKEIDSLKKEVDTEMKNFIIPVPEKTRKIILDEVDKQAKDSTFMKDLEAIKIESQKDSTDDSINLDFDSKLNAFMDYVKENPNPDINNALDSLGYEKNFTNRFLFTRAKSLHSFSKNEETREQYFNQLLSYGSIALFIFLPFFTLFLKFYFIRRKYTYVDHLIFVFHVQTVFFMLFSIYFIFLIFHVTPAVWVFLILFLIYLYLAMKKFYQQGYFKTFLKFILLNISFGFIASFGMGILFLISFAIF
ncbi:hypothetical protein [Polaribacter sp. MED152]|uniref:hypothetical protein n=1 Tax=Polaribacter sp. MED152 TaxID=313598 RepID=UPI00006899B7|nr:hypothetical protein [Polaribacter sp. MED152]EAQ40694.1 hypothetical protein MED152_11689 [Polaribacter sp. MED152]